MLRTPAARDRIQRWAAAGGLRPDTPVARCGVIPRIACVGDVALQSLVEDALAKIPVSVLDHLRKNAVLLPIGRSCAVLTAQLPAPERDADEARHVILVEYQRVHVAIDDSERAAAAFEALLGHECAHSFLRPIVSKDEMRDAPATVERRVPAPLVPKTPSVSDDISGEPTAPSSARAHQPHGDRGRSSCSTPSNLGGPSGR